MSSVRASSRSLAARFVGAAVLGVAATGGASGCGSRTELYVPDLDAGVVELPCEDGETSSCGSSVGACEEGVRTCLDATFGPCEGQIGPVVEACNGLDDDCDGSADEGFGIGEACDGPDSDLCLDDVTSCAGCSRGPDQLEVCNGEDDDCDGVVDADCESGDCSPELLVTGSVPSSPSCVDFPVAANSTGIIRYPCGGGFVTAELGTVTFTGTVDGGVVSLGGVEIIDRARSPDDCVWQTNHQITGNVTSGKLAYSYSEAPIEGFDCWSPCTETGTVAIQWAR